MLNYNTEIYNINKLINSPGKVLVVGRFDSELVKALEEKNCEVDYINDLVDFNILDYTVIRTMDYTVKYEHIIMIDVIDYVFDVKLILIELKKLLTESGKIVCSFVNFDHNTFLLDTLNDVVGPQKIEDVNVGCYRFLTTPQVQTYFNEIGMHHQKSKYVYVIPRHINLNNPYIKYLIYARELFINRPNSHIIRWQMIFSQNENDLSDLIEISNDNYDEVHFKGSGYLELPISYSDDEYSFTYTNGEDTIEFLPSIRVRGIKLEIFDSNNDIIIEKEYFEFGNFIKLELPHGELKFKLKRF